MTRAHEFSRFAKKKLLEVFGSLSEDAAPEDVGKAEDSENGGEGESGGTEESS